MTQINLKDWETWSKCAGNENKRIYLLEFCYRVELIMHLKVDSKIPDQLQVRKLNWIILTTEGSRLDFKQNKPKRCTHFLSTFWTEFKGHDRTTPRKLCLLFIVLLMHCSFSVEKCSIGFVFICSIKLWQQVYNYSVHL